MSQQLRNVFVGGIYNWNSAMAEKELRKNRDYPRHNWCDIDTADIKNLEGVLAVFKKYGISCISQRCGKGFHVFGDIVPFDLWLKIWDEIRPYADPLWQPHTLRVTKKKLDEVWEKPLYHQNGNDNNIKPWMRSLMSFLCKTLRNKNSTNIWSAMHHVGLDKYFQCTVYPVEVK